MKKEELRNCLVSCLKRGKYCNSKEEYKWLNKEENVDILFNGLLNVYGYDIMECEEKDLDDDVVDDLLNGLVDRDFESSEVLCKFE